MTYSPDRQNFSNSIELSDENISLEQIEQIKSSLQKLRESHNDNFSKQIFNILIFQIYNFLKRLESQLINPEEVKELLLILQNPDELQLQFEYFNWLFIKIINHKQKLILPYNNKELKVLSTSFYSQVGSENYKFAKDINEAQANNTLTFEQLNLAFTCYLIHSEPSGWELCPDYQGMKSFSAKYKLENPNWNEDEDE